MKKRNFMFDKSFIKLILLAVCIFISYRLVFDFYGITSNFFGAISFFLNLLTYFLWGFAIAFVLNQVMLFFRKIFGFIKRERIKSVLSILMTYILALGIITLFIVAVVPAISTSVKELIDNIPTYAKNIQDIYARFQEYMLTKFDVELKDFVNINYTKITETVRDFLLSKNGIPMITRWLTNTTGIVVNFIFGFIISIYMLIGKSDFSKGAKNIIYALFSDKRREKIYDVAQRANTIFSKFLFGKLIDSIIIGIIAYIFFLILGVRYSLLLAFIVGITNIIPYFGPLFGGVVVCSIVLFTNAGFIKFLIAVAGILLIQQFDGWILDPKILHGQIGINPLIIIAGVSIGGSIGGFIGMLIGVPLLALIKELFYDEYIMNKIKMKKCAEAAATEEHITDGGGDKEE